MATRDESGRSGPSAPSPAAGLVPPGFLLGVATAGFQVEGGFNGDSAQRTKAPLVVLETDNLESMLEKVKAAGGIITFPIFSFPGGRRFHFTDPSGNELSVMQKA